MSLAAAIICVYEEAPGPFNETILLLNVLVTLVVTDAIPETLTSAFELFCVFMAVSLVPPLRIKLLMVIDLA